MACFPLRRRVPLRGTSILRLWRAPSLRGYSSLLSNVRFAIRATFDVHESCKSAVGFWWFVSKEQEPRGSLGFFAWWDETRRLRDIRRQTLVSSFRAIARNLCHLRSRTHVFPICAAHLSAFLICLSCRQCPIRPYGAPSPRGEGWRYEGNLPSQTFGHRFIYICGEAATTTPNPEPRTLNLEPYFYKENKFYDKNKRF